MTDQSMRCSIRNLFTHKIIIRFLQVHRPVAMRKDAIQTRKRKPRSQGSSSKKSSSDGCNRPPKVSTDMDMSKPSSALPFGGLPNSLSTSVITSTGYTFPPYLPSAQVMPEALYPQFKNEPEPDMGNDSMQAARGAYHTPTDQPSMSHSENPTMPNQHNVSPGPASEMMSANN